MSLHIVKGSFIEGTFFYGHTPFSKGTTSTKVNATMGFKKNRDRSSHELNAGSMADIAFLLLIFFLVSTTIIEDKGILVRLPVWIDDPEVTALNQDNVLNIMLNANNEVLLEGTLVSSAEIKDRVVDFVLNPNKDQNKPMAPNKAIISLQNDRSTKYASYLNVYDQITIAYNEMWDNQAMNAFQVHFDELSKNERKQVKDKIPFVVSEAEPTDFQK